MGFTVVCFGRLIVQESVVVNVTAVVAHLAKRVQGVGDLLVIMSFAQFQAEEAKAWKPKVLVLADGNKRVVRADNVLVAEDVFYDC